MSVCVVYGDDYLIAKYVLLSFLDRLAIEILTFFIFKWVKLFTLKPRSSRMIIWRILADSISEPCLCFNSILLRVRTKTQRAAIFPAASVVRDRLPTQSDTLIL